MVNPSLRKLSHCNRNQRLVLARTQVQHRNRMVLAQEPHKVLEQVLHNRNRRHRQEDHRHREDHRAYLGDRHRKACGQPYLDVHRLLRRNQQTICDENSRKHLLYTSKKFVAAYASLGQFPIASVVRCSMVLRHNIEQKLVRRMPNKQKQKEQT